MCGNTLDILQINILREIAEEMDVYDEGGLKNQ
jgi:hypothetical protein